MSEADKVFECPGWPSEAKEGDICWLSSNRVAEERVGGGDLQANDGRKRDSAADVEHLAAIGNAGFW